MGVIKITNAAPTNSATIQVTSTIEDLLNHPSVHYETDKNNAKEILKKDLFKGADFNFPVIVKLDSQKFKIEWDDNGVPDYSKLGYLKGGRRRTKRSKRSKRTRRAKRRA
jgi:hypothetical protein